MTGGARMQRRHAGMAEHRRRWLLWEAVAGISVASVVVFVGITSPRFFFAGDKQNQYLPVARDIGRRLRAGEWLPVIDPDLGRGGNYALDLQYGLFEPSHWLADVALSLVPDQVLAALLWAAAYLLLLALGVCAVLLRLGARGSWAAATAVGVAFSGYLMFWAAPSWIPALTSLAWVPWWWRSVLARPRAVTLVATGVLTFLVVGGGWPATWLIWAALAAGYVVEAVVRRAEPGVLRAGLVHTLAAAGGAVAALVTVLPLERAVDYTSRSTSVENNGMLVANLADVLGFASPALAGDLNAFGAYPERAPLFFGVWFVVVLAWLVPWRRALLRRPALVTSLVGLLVTLLLTQAPSALGPLRWPIRFVPGVPLFLGVGTAAAVAAGGLVLTRGRVAGALLGVLATGVLSVFRLPTSLDPVVGSVLLAAAAGVLLLAVARAGSRFAGAAALAGTLVLVAWTATVHAADGMADRGIPSTPRPGRLVLDQRPTLLLFTRNSPPRAFAEGVTSGFARLGADQRTQPGYSSIGQKGWDQRFCVRSAHSDTCPAAVQRLFEVEPRTGLPWVDLLGYRDVVVEQGRPLARMQRITRATGGWEETGRSRDYVRFSRVTPPGTTGRVTAVLGQASVTALDVARSSQGYRVRSARGATLVFRDLYWPGYVATLDGAPLAVGRLSDTLVTVDVPAGADGRLTLEYVAMPPTMWMPPVGAGVVGIGLAVVLARPGRPLRRPLRRPGRRR